MAGAGIYLDGAKTYFIGLSFSVSWSYPIIEG